MKGVLGMNKVDNINRLLSSIDDENSLEITSLRDAFGEWLAVSNIKRFSPTVCMSCLDKVSDYAVQNKICKISLWSITHYNVFQSIYNKLLEVKMLRVTEKDTYKVFIIAGKAYIRFLKDKPWIKDVVRNFPATVINDGNIKEVLVSNSEQRHNNLLLPQNSFSNINPDDFVNWLIKQKNSRGTLYLERVARQYSWYLHSSPHKLEISLSEDKRDVYAVQTIEEFDILRKIFFDAPNYKQVNECGHQTFSAGLNAYRRYLKSFTEQKENVKEGEKFNMEKVRVVTDEGGEVVAVTSQVASLPDSIISVLIQDYPYGFNFDTTSVRLLTEKSGVDLDVNIQNTLKNFMFCRKDGIYFLLDTVADSETRQEIIDFAGDWLCNYGYFEITELYTHFTENINEKAIGDVYDFETFYEYINRSQIRCVAYYNTRMARVNNKSIRELSLGIAEKIISITHDEFGGTVTEEDLLDRFPAFSANLLSNIIKEHAEELVKTEINGIVCYQTLDALGISDEFSDTLVEVLEQIDEVGLIPNEEVIHTALSILLGVNFKLEYNIPDDKTYRRLIAAYYKGAPNREWKRNIFAEV